MTKVTEAERDLIEDLLRQDKKDLTMEAMSFLTGRSVRTIYYIAAEMRRKEESRIPVWKRLLNKVRGNNYEENITSRTRQNGRA